MPDSVRLHSMTSGGVVEVRAESACGLFSSFDPAPMAGRRLSPEVDSYILGCVKEIDGAGAVGLRIALPEGEAGFCDDVREAFCRHYAASAANRRAELRQHFKDAGVMLLKGVCFALVLIGIANLVAQIADTILISKIVSGLSLIVWVSLWKPVDMLLYEWRPIMDEVKLLDRLDGCEVTCGVA